MMSIVPQLSKNRAGSILLAALWVLGLLAILALSIGMGARQKITILKRLDDRARSRLAAEAGAKKAIAFLLDNMEENQFMLTLDAKIKRHNSPDEFNQVPLGEDGAVFTVSYDEWNAFGDKVERYGLVDERSKLNLNTTNKFILERLISEVLGMTANDAARLAVAIVDWRDFGKHEADGFFSEDHYNGLKDPYDMKEDPFERPDELLLVRGMDLEKYERLLPYVTIWGDGKLNINTVSRTVLNALGLDADVVEKILLARQGEDGLDATGDDHIFFRTYDVAVEVKMRVGLKLDEMRQIDELNAQNVFGTDSFIYSLRSRSRFLDGGNRQSEVRCAFNTMSNKILYWYEK